MAAGQGKRLLPLTKKNPKILIKVGDKTIIEHMLDRLVACEVKDVILVLGFNGNEVKNKINGRYKNLNIKYIFNRMYHRTNNIYSLWLTNEEIDDELILINGDDLFSSQLLKKLIDSHHSDAALIDDSNLELPEEAMKVTITDGLIKDVSKEIPPEKAHGDAIGVYKFSIRGSKIFFEEIKKLIDKGRTNEYYLRALQQMVEYYEFYPVSTDGLFWIEIDDHQDLENAQDIMKKIEQEDQES